MATLSQFSPFFPLLFIQSGTLAQGFVSPTLGEGFLSSGSTLTDIPKQFGLNQVEDGLIATPTDWNLAYEEVYSWNTCAL